MSNTILTAGNLILEGNVTKENVEAFVFLGSVDSAGSNVNNTLDGSVIVGKRDSAGTNIVPLKTITDLTAANASGSRFILPANQELVVICVDGGTTDLYCEVQFGSRVNP